MITASFNEAAVQLGLITSEKLEEVLKSRADTTEPVDRLLVRLGHITERERAKCLSHLYQVPFVDFAGVNVDTSLAQLLPHRLAVRYRAIPTEQQGNTLVVAMANPMDVIAIDEIARATGCEIETQIALDEDITEAIFRCYGSLDDVSEIIGEAVRDTDLTEIKVLEEEREAELSLTELREMVEGAPVVRLVNVVISRAIAARASDIHIEPGEERVRVRFRVDGMLQEAMNIPKDLQYSVISRIKVMANMDIAERRAPQDGRLTLVTRPSEYDLRISTYPAVHGENVVMRILDKAAGKIGLAKLGLRPEDQACFEDLLSRPYGMILACGPTGCGKTTTLYAALNMLNSVEKNILTIEDPVEYQLPGIVQANVNRRAGMTFATGLRTIVRQDPDIVMVGEIRDQETAEIAIEAALTGHLVFSTLHTNDAAGAVSRLLDMGIEPFLVASAFLGVVAQRLVRVVCPKCKVMQPADPDALALLGLDREASAELQLAHGNGCESCTRTGYRGRIGVFELMPVDDDLRRLIVNRAAANVIRDLATSRGMLTLREDALNKIRQGLTTVEEVLRVTQE